MDQNYNNYPPTQPEQPQQPQWQAPAEPQQPQWQTPQQPQWQQQQEPQWQAPAEPQQPQWQTQQQPQWQTQQQPQWQSPTEQQWQGPNEPMEYPQPPIPPKKKKGSALMWLLIAIGVLALAAVGAALYFFLWQSPEPSRSNLDVDYEDEEYVDDQSDLDDEDSAYDISAEEESDLLTDEPTNGEPTDDELEPQPTTDVPEAAEAVKPELNLVGDADGFPLSLQLTIADNGRVTGEYKNLQNNSTVSVSGTKNGDVISLSGQSGRRTIRFRITPSGHIYTGTFTNASGQQQELHLTVQ